MKSAGSKLYDDDSAGLQSDWSTFEGASKKLPRGGSTDDGILSMRKREDASTVRACVRRRRLR